MSRRPAPVRGNLAAPHGTSQQRYIVQQYSYNDLGQVLGSGKYEVDRAYGSDSSWAIKATYTTVKLFDNAYDARGNRSEQIGYDSSGVANKWENYTYRGDRQPGRNEPGRNEPGRNEPGRAGHLTRAE